LETGGMLIRMDLGSIARMVSFPKPTEDSKPVLSAFSYKLQLQTQDPTRLPRDMAQASSTISTQKY
jgi:hypothetical protein